MTLVDRRFGTIWNSQFGNLFRRSQLIANSIPAVKTLSAIEKKLAGINLTCSIRNQSRTQWYLRILLETLLLHCSKALT
jgi:hypothetical protein